MPATNSIPLALSFMEVGCKTNHPCYGSPLLIYIIATVIHGPNISISLLQIGAKILHHDFRHRLNLARPGYHSYSMSGKR